MMTGTAEKIGVVGAGLGGLAAACTLAARGHQVVLFDKNPWLGGKAAVHQQAGYRFDMGPTILTVPSVLHRLFAEAGRQTADYLDLIRLDPQWRSFFEDGTTLDLCADVPTMAAAVDRFTGRPEQGSNYRRFMELSQRQAAVSRRLFFWKNVGGMRDTFRWEDLLRPGLLSDLQALRLGRSVAGTVRSYVPDARVAQMIDHFTQYVGSCPDNAPAVLCGIAHLQTDEGVWYPRGGTGAVPAALEKLAQELGVEIRSSTAIRKILTTGRQVTGVETEAGEQIPLQAVISNCDTVRTHRELLDREVSDAPALQKTEPACSGVVLYLGLRQSYDHLLHHNFVFSRDPHEEFEAIYRRGEPAPDPTCYVCAPACTEPQVAPAGGEALYILVHTPYLRPGHDWNNMLPKYRQVIFDKLARTAGLTDLAERIEGEHVLTPADIHRRYQVLNGAIYGLASHGRWFGAFKPANKSRRVKGLYFAGGSAHPGPGMPMALMSGWIAADTLDQTVRETTGSHA